jgi:beta-ketoacyl-acyl-carrier-protein synthase II
VIRVVVSGLGAVTPVGNDVSATWQAVVSGRSGIDFTKRFEASGFAGAIAGEVRDFDPEAYFPGRRSRNMDRSTQFGLAAAREALRDAGLEEMAPLGERAGVVFGSAFGGHGVVDAQRVVLEGRGPRRVSPYTLSAMIPDSASGQIAILTGSQGPNMAVLSASASGASAIGEAAEVIRRGDADLMIAGAAEAPLTPLLYAGFSAMRGIAEAGEDPRAACRPFDAERTGFVVAEGAAAVVLESFEHLEARRGRAYAELAGYGSANDAYHMIAEDASGRGLVLAMRMAIRKAGIDPAQIGYVNAHGTASRMNDRVETAAIKEAFGAQAKRLAVSSTKSITGHLMGAAGAIEAVISVLALYYGLLPPTINYANPDPECDLDYVPNTAREAPGLEAVMTNSVGLGGHNASLVFRRLE